MSLVPPEAWSPRQENPTRSAIEGRRGLSWCWPQERLLRGCWECWMRWRGWVGGVGPGKLGLTWPRQQAAAAAAWTLVLLLPSTAPSSCYCLTSQLSFRRQTTPTQCFTFESCLWKVTKAEMLESDYLSCVDLSSRGHGWAISQETSEKRKTQKFEAY